MKTMKNMDMKFFFRSMTAAFAVCAVMAVSCEEPVPPVPQVEPSFPTLVEKSDVEPGSVLTLTFDANMDWTVTVPSETFQWFWLNDGSFKVDKLSGKVIDGESERVTLSVGVSATEEFDMNRSCDVTLTMGGKSQVIARYMRPAKNRTLNVYVAKAADGDFVMNGTGGFEYGYADGPADFLWSAADAEYILPLRVESNCEWTVETPEWLDIQLPESTTGTIEVILTGASLEAATGTLKFIAGDTTLDEIDVNIPACGIVELYTTQSENGDFLFDDSGEYLYSESPVDKLTLVWPGSDYRMPVMVDSRCDWALEMPEWLDVKYVGDVPERNAGITRFILMGDPKHYPLEDVTEKIRFTYEGKTVREVEVTIPGCSDKFGYGLDMSLTSLEFDPVGKVMTSMGFQDLPATAWLTGTSQAAVYAVETIDGKYAGRNADWITFDIDPYVQGAEVLQRRTLVIRPADNDGEERSAYILFSKVGAGADSFFESDGALKPDMEEFAISVVQYGSDMEYVIMTYSEEEMASAGATMTYSDNPRLQGWFGKTDFVYELTYSNPYARDKAFMTFATPYSSYKVFNNSREDVTANESFWLRFTSNDGGNTAGVIDMYNGMTPPETENLGYVVFYDADGSVLAIIVAVYDPAKVADVEVNVEFIGESASYAEMVGATLEEVTADTDKELFDTFKEYCAPIYHLTYRTQGFPMRVSIPSNAVMYNPNPYAKRHIFVVNGLDYDEYVGDFELIDGGVDIYMILDEGSDSVYERGQILFHDAENNVVLVLVCTLDLTGSF